MNIAASCFSIYAFEALKAELEKIDELHFIFTSPTFINKKVTDKIRKEHKEFHIPKSDRERSLYGNKFEMQLGNMLPIRNFDELKSLRGKEYSGDALYDQLIKDAADATRRRGPMFDPEGCFVACTLVHTKDGLRAIEEIQVGDWVLAKDESGQGETAYKRVRETHRFEDKEVWYLQFSWLGPQSER